MLLSVWMYIHRDIHVSCTAHSQVPWMHWHRPSTLLILCPGSDTQLLDDLSSFKFASKYRFTVQDCRRYSHRLTAGTCAHLQPCFNPWHLDSSTWLLMLLPVAGCWSRDTYIPALTLVAAINFHSHKKRSHQGLGLSPHMLIHREGSYSETSLKEEWRLCSSGAKLRQLYWPFSAFPCFVPSWIHSYCIFHSPTPHNPGLWFTVLSVTNPGWSSWKWCLPWKPDWWGLFRFIVYMFVFWCLSLCIFWFWSPLFPLFPNWHIVRLYNLTGMSLVLLVQAVIP